ncbi:MAG: aminotransferase class III-fold pyridoxal phosphate-dependent enzyme, partial [Candidatus Omnitrophica bacterium]|nr:aminotransferase class III-fold pyridoxal phosphate-dependent enzyme [Candidatus Omnitrophota bacterium]
MNKTWFNVSDIEKMTPKEKVSLTEEYVNPGMIKLLKILGFDNPWGVSAEGVYIDLNDGRKILDMTGGSCVLGLGHNHPRILEVRKKFAENKRMEICKAFVSPYVAALAANMASLLPGDLQYSYFCGGGADAIESALKLAQKYGGKNRLGLVYTDHSFHGKSFGAMSVSSMEEHRHNFQLLEKCYKVPYGDIDALGKLFRSRCSENNKIPDICAFILEAVHGTRIIFPPEGYLKKVRELCTQYDVLLIIDEIYVGFGRTGYWFAFEADGIVPDIVCYSKSFGGGKASIAGFTARKPVFLQAYGKS